MLRFRAWKWFWTIARMCGFMVAVTVCSYATRWMGTRAEIRQPVTPKKPHVAVWYMTDEGKAVRCTGKPHLVIRKDGSIARAVEGCAGKWPQVILHD